MDQGRTLGGVAECSACGATNEQGARYCSRCGSALVAAGLGETRKVVTIVFADVAGSTAVGERLDPESLRRVMTRHFDEIQRVIAEHGGVVEKFIGDAVMAVFGVPRVHEDDALRAVRAASAMRDCLADLDAELRDRLGVSIAWRIGVNTGEVVAGDAGAGQRFVTGDAVNLAKRLEEAAGAGDVLIGAATHQLVRNAVEVEVVAPVAVKGKAQHVEAYRLASVADQVTGPARRVDAPMVGRQRQRELLAHAFAQAVAERACHLFTILGAPGVGKSRLVAEFLSGLGTDITVLRGRCLSYGHGITFWPIREMVHSAAGVRDTDAPDSARAKLAALLTDAAEAERIAAGLGTAIGLADAEVAGEEIARAVRLLFETLAERRPLVAVFDDVHWAEPALLDLIDHVSDWATDAPILMLCIARHDLFEMRPHWGGGKLAATTIRLEPLSAEESETLITGLIGTASLDADARHRIAEAADGNPLFVEELLAMLIDDGALVRRNGGWAAGTDLGSITVPPTIQALLAARLDRLAQPERVVVECGAVEGKVFHASAVSALVPDLVREDVPLHLMALTRKELLRPDHAVFSGDDAYQFRHLLIRDVAYQAIPKAARAELHERFADWLEASAGERRTEYEEILGHHLEHAYRYRSELAMPAEEVALLAQRAGTYLASAGERAVDRGDLHAGRRLLEPALELLGDDQRTLRLRLRLAETLYWGGDLSAARRQAAAALEAYRRRGDAVGAANARVVLLEIRNAMEHTESAQVLAQAEELASQLAEAGDRRGFAAATVIVAQHLFFSGRQAEAARRLTDAIAEFPQGTRERSRLSRWLIACLRWGPTPVSEAIPAIERIVADNPGHPLIEALALRHLGALNAMGGRFDEARAMLDRSERMAREMGQTTVAESTSGHFRTYLELLAGDWERAAELGRHAFEVMSATGDQAFASTVAGLVGVALTRLGRWDEAERYAGLALEMSASDDFESQAIGHQVLARVNAARGEFTEAERLAREAVAICAQTDSIDRHGEALVDLAAVLEAARRAEEARAPLGEALELYWRKGNVVSARRTEKALARLEG